MQALRELERVCKPGGRIIIPTYLNRTAQGKTNRVSDAIGKAGADFKREFTLESYRQFLARAGYPDAQFILCAGRISLRDSSVSAHVILTRALQTRPASLGSRLKGGLTPPLPMRTCPHRELHPTARIFSAPLAQKFHSAAWVRLDQLCRAALAQLESHPLAAGENDSDFICAVRGANSAKLFIFENRKCPHRGWLVGALVGFVRFRGCGRWAMGARFAALFLGGR